MHRLPPLAPEVEDVADWLASFGAQPMKITIDDVDVTARAKLATVNCWDQRTTIDLWVGDPFDFTPGQLVWIWTPRIDWLPRPLRWLSRRFPRHRLFFVGAITHLSSNGEIHAQDALSWWTEHAVVES